MIGKAAFENSFWPSNCLFGMKYHISVLYSPVSPPSISHSNPSKKVAHNWHLASTTTISASNALYGTWDQIVSSEEKGRWSNGDWNFCDIEILERANSSPHLAGSDPIDQGTIVTSSSSPVPPCLPS